MKGCWTPVTTCRTSLLDFNTRESSCPAASSRDGCSSGRKGLADQVPMVAMLSPGSCFWTSTSNWNRLSPLVDQVTVSAGCPGNWIKMHNRTLYHTEWPRIGCDTTSTPITITNHSLQPIIIIHLCKQKEPGVMTNFSLAKAEFGFWEKTWTSWNNTLR